MKTKELKKWLRDNSSGTYRPSAEAADYIQRLEDRIERIERVAKEMLHRATEGMPKEYADGKIGLTDHQAAAICLKGALSDWT